MPNVTKTVCLLANSVKHGGACIAGIEVAKKANRWKSTGQWVRPLGASPTGEIQPHEATLSGKARGLQLLDIVEMEFLCKAAVPGQPEDWKMAPNRKWKFLDHLSGNNVVDQFIEAPPDLWIEGGRRDRVTPAFLASHQLPSLYLVKPDGFSIVIREIHDQQSGTTWKKRRVNLEYAGETFDIGLTDPEMQRRYFPNYPAVPNGQVPGVPLPAAVCLSLAPEFNGYHYKLCASVFI